MDRFLKWFCRKYLLPRILVAEVTLIAPKEDELLLLYFEGITDDLVPRISEGLNKQFMTAKNIIVTNRPFQATVAKAPKAKKLIQNKK